jgi:hypothetical protein
VHKVEFELVARDGTWKAEIFRRLDGTYGFRPYRWSAADGCWFPGGRFLRDSFTLSADAAEAEARTRVPQLGRTAKKIAAET